MSYRTLLRLICLVYLVLIGHLWVDAVSIHPFPTVTGKRGIDIQLAVKGHNLAALGF